ncbi:MAG: AMP-binding protein, partial [Acidobacteriota bacterium]
MNRHSADHLAGSPSSSPEMAREEPAATLGDILRGQARRQGDKTLYRFLVDGEADGPVEELTFAELDRQARAIGAWLQKRGAAGERALLLYPPGLEFVKAFLGCLYAAAIAVPAYPPDPSRLHRSLPRMQAIAADSEARFVLTTQSLLRQSDALLPQLPELEKLSWAGTDIRGGGACRRLEERPRGGRRPCLLAVHVGFHGPPQGSCSHAPQPIPQPRPASERTHKRQPRRPGLLGTGRTRHGPDHAPALLPPPGRQLHLDVAGGLHSEAGPLAGGHVPLSGPHERVARVDSEALARGRWVRSQHSDESTKRVVGCGRAWLDQEILI